MYFLVWTGERSETVRNAVEHPHHEDRVVRISLGWPVAVLAVLSCVGGLLAVPSVWEPFATWIDEVAPSEIVPSSALDWETSAIAVTIGVIGIAIAWAIYRAHRLATPAVPPLRALLEHKFYFDELYDALFYRPAALLAARLRSDVEEPFVEGSLDEIGKAGQETAGAVARAQTGLLRTYAIAVAASAVVLAVVFIAVR
jgi:NADH-quinone oxidoreductase subunit L